MAVTVLNLQSEASAEEAPLTHWIASQGSRLHLYEYPGPTIDSASLLLVHGSRGHSGWWDEVIPRLTRHYRVFAFDFAGMGDSDHRPAYSQDMHVEDLLTVSAAVKHICGQPLRAIIAHSWGGQITLLAAAQQPTLALQLLILDSYCVLPSETRELSPPPRGNQKIYPTADAAAAAFRLSPPQPEVAHRVTTLAHKSMRRCEGGWRWKFDPNMAVAQALDILSIASRLTLPVAVIYGANSEIISTEMASELVELLPQGLGPHSLPDAHHHLMLDQPEALSELLCKLLLRP
jgi:pimeloyl-ACP methyl ester carboxylesterase